MYSPLDFLSIETWILLIMTAACLRYYVRQCWNVLEDLNIPHNPPSLLKLGNLGDFGKDPDSFFKMDLERKKKFGRVYGSYAGLTPRIAISDPKILKQIMIKEFSNFGDRQRTFSTINGKEMNVSLTAASGSRWKRIRNTLSPTFTTSKLKDMFGIAEQCTDHMISNLKAVAEKENGKFLAKDVFGNLSMDVICSAAFSVQLRYQDGDGKQEPQAVKMGKKLFDISISTNVFLVLFFMFPSLERVGSFFGYCIFPRSSIKYFAALTDSLIKTKGDDQTRADLMRLMLSNEITEKDVKEGIARGLTRNEIVGNSMLMILAGYETTANTMLFLAYNLAIHKEIQDKLKKEIDQVVQENGELNYEAVNELKYLMQCINETLRLYPAIPRNSRYCEKEITIDGIRIPKDIHVDIPVYGMTRDEEYWDEPLKFKPERMEDMSKIDPMIFQPFGAGPRSCLGMRFALMEIKMAFCKLLINFELDVCKDTPTPPLDLTFRGSLRPKQDVYLKVIARSSE